MSKFNVSALFKTAQRTISRHSPEILTGIGIAGMITTTILAVKATPKAEKLIELECERQNRERRNEATENGDECFSKITKLKPIEVVKVTWKCYIPTAISCATSVACLIGASSVNAKRNAALAAAYNLSATALSEYKEKVVETIGEKKEHTVKDKIAEEHVKKNPVSKNEVIVTKTGNTLCFDAISGRYFKSDIDKIKKAENELNKRMLSEMYISLNEFFDELGLDHISIGDDLGWNLDGGLIDLDFSSQIADDGTPCLVVNYQVTPKYGYSSLV